MLSEAISDFLIGKVIWAKDLVFLFTSGEELGPQAWVEAYLGIDNSGNSLNTPISSHSPISSRGRVVKAMD